MRVLTVDIGNTALKGSVFEDGLLLDSILSDEREASALVPLIDKFDPQGCITCCVGEGGDHIVFGIREHFAGPVLRLMPSMPLPVRVEYGTRATLGVDRVAAAVGASLECGAALVVDAGTAVTLDVVAHGAFLGGNISPGLKLRFRALNRFTSRLPLVSPSDDVPSFGHDTETAIRAGVVNGIVAEILAAHEAARREYGDVRLLLTGGDARYLEPLLRKAGGNPQRCPTLVGRGLEAIYVYNMCGNPGEIPDDCIVR